MRCRKSNQINFLKYIIVEEENENGEGGSKFRLGKIPIKATVKKNSENKTYSLVFIKPMAVFMTKKIPLKKLLYICIIRNDMSGLWINLRILKKEN